MNDMDVDAMSDGDRSGVGRLDGKVAIVTGASRGIGAAVARAFAAAGAHVALAARQQGALEGVAAQLEGLGVSASARWRSRPT